MLWPHVYRCPLIFCHQSTICNITLSRYVVLFQGLKVEPWFRPVVIGKSSVAPPHIVTFLFLSIFKTHSSVALLSFLSHVPTWTWFLMGMFLFNSWDCPHVFNADSQYPAPHLPITEFRNINISYITHEAMTCQWKHYKILSMKERC